MEATDFGNRGGLIPLPNNNNSLAIKGNTQLASREIGDVIVKTFATITEALEKEDSTLEPSQIEKAVTNGINKSIIKDLTKGGSGSGTSISKNSKSDNALAEQIAKKTADDERKRQEYWKKQEEQERRDHYNKVEESIDKAMKGLNAFSHNPLKGISDGIDKAFKGIFHGMDHILNTPVGKLKDELKGVGQTLASPVVQTGKFLAGGVSSAVALGKFASGSLKSNSIIDDNMDMDSLINDDVENNDKPVVKESKKDNDGKSNTGEIDMDSLINDDKDKSEKDQKEQSENKKTEESQELQKKQVTAVNEMKNATIKQMILQITPIVIGITAIAALIPIIIGNIAAIFADSKIRNAELKASLNAAFFGPNNLVNKLKWSLMELLKDVKIFGKPIYGPGLSTEDNNRLEELELKKTNASTANTNLQTYYKKLSKLAKYYGMQNFDPDNDEQMATLQSRVNEMDAPALNNLLQNIDDAKSKTFSEEELNEYNELIAKRNDVGTAVRLEREKAKEAEVKYKTEKKADYYNGEVTSYELNKLASSDPDLKAEIDSRLKSNRMNRVENTSAQNMVERKDKYVDSIKNFVIQLKDDTVGAGTKITAGTSPRA